VPTGAATSCSVLAFITCPPACSAPQKAQGLPVHFHIGVAAHVIEELLHSSLVQWHLTGIELGPGVEDPASEEHFGISIAEGGPQRPHLCRHAR
jgi:hypothetical protein